MRTVLTFNSSEKTFHYARWTDQGSVEGYGSFSLENEELVLQFKGTKRVVEFITKEVLDDSISISFLDHSPSYKLEYGIVQYDNVTGSSTNSVRNEVIIKNSIPVEIYSNSFKNSKVTVKMSREQHETVIATFDQSGRYVIQPQFVKGFEGLYQSREVSFPIKNISRNGFILEDRGNRFDYSKT